MGTDGAGGDEQFSVRVKRSPPKTLSDEGKCSMKTGMASQFRRMAPLEDQRPGSVRNKHPIRWTVVRRRLSLLRCLDGALDVPPGHSNNTLGG